MSFESKATAAMAAAVLVAVIALIVLVTTLSSCGSSVDGYVDEHYTRAGERNGAKHYTSGDRIEKVVADITDAWKPADRLSDPGGVFLRYADSMVAVRPAAYGGSEIDVDDPERAYAHWYPYVGGWFGNYSGPAESFRGGGPGSGK
jgi:hypothetical protein